MHSLIVNISLIATYRTNILLPTHGKSPAAFRLAYLYLHILRVNVKVKVKVKGKFTVMHISTTNISKMVRDGANIIISIKYEDAYGLSMRIFRFDLGPF